MTNAYFIWQNFSFFVILSEKVKIFCWVLISKRRLINSRNRTRNEHGLFIYFILRTIVIYA